MVGLWKFHAATSVLMLRLHSLEGEGCPGHEAAYLGVPARALAGRPARRFMESLPPNMFIGPGATARPLRAYVGLSKKAGRRSFRARKVLSSWRVRP